MNHDTTGLFSITQAANACGISRSTLMRMEERGLLVPAYISPQSGRRYYDNHNISRVLQIQQFQSMGFNAEETASYFAKEGEANELLAILEERLSLLQQNVEEMKLRSMKIPNMSVQILRLPETLCCVQQHTGKTLQERYDAMYHFYHECIEKGYVLAKEPLFVVHKRTDYLEGELLDVEHPFQVCVPILAKKAPADAVRFPACTALSVLWYGYDNNSLQEAWLTLGREAKNRGLTPAAFPRTLGIVAPYTGREINPKQYCSRIVLAVTE